MDPLPPTYPATKHALQRVAVHVVARRRKDLTGRFGLRIAAGGFAMPAAGPEHEVLRTSGTRLVREVTGATASTTSIDLATATLAEAAAFAGVDLATPLDIGHDTPEVGDAGAALGVDAAAAHALAAWLAFAGPVLDAVIAGLPEAATPTVLQLWPEHFDAGCDVAAGSSRVNLGASTGDAFVEQPYLYVGPWEARTDDPFWNASFGAVRTYDELRAATDPAAEAAAFFRQGIDLLV